MRKCRFTAVQKTFAALGFTFACSGWCFAYVLYINEDRNHIISTPKTIIERSEMCGFYPTDSVTKASSGGNIHLMYDFRTRNPRWSLERLRRNDDKNKTHIPRPLFRQENYSLIPLQFQGKASDFKASIYDKGHMAAAANHKGNPTEYEETFVMTNVSPQVGIGFNRHYWNSLENYIRKIAASEGVEEAYVLTGPLFLPVCRDGSCVLKHPVIGDPPMISVPTHFFKVILLKANESLASKLGDNYIIAGFVLPNEKIDPKTPLLSFVRPVHEIESLSGLKFFPCIEADIASLNSMCSNPMTLENPKEPRLKAVPESINFAEQEEYTLQKWESEKTFQKSMEMAEAAELPDFTFYDGPPFATGLPHYGHILAGTIKDVVTRYAHQTGHRVVRRFGWDCHGLPVEYEIDQMLGITGPSDVEKMGIAAYNDHCRSIVMRYATEWESIVKRMGRWIDFENDYKTLDVDFMESVWWVFKQLFEKGLVYQGFKVMPFSTQCNTPLSNFESGLNYKDVSDPAVVVAMRVKDGGKFEGASLLAWTTTPWTLPSNLALCVNEKFDYVLLKEFESGNKYILGKSRIEELYPKKKKAKKSKEPLPYEIFSEFKGSELVGVQYYPLFDYFEDTFQASAFRVLSDDYVTDDSGTGIVHQAPAFGEDDYRVCLAHGVIEKKGSLLCPVAVDVSGLFTMPIRDFVGIHVKKSDKMIIQHLKESGNLVRQNQIVHSYPHCWRSDTPLIYKAVPSWFVDVPAIRDRLVANNAKTYWVPSFVKEKRFHNWLEGAREWAISRNRYWGTPLPIWKSDDGEEIRVVGSIDELRELTGNPEVGFDLHRDSIDHLTIPSQQGKGALRRVPEVFDCWFESGSMPYAQMHYPFENKEAFDNGLFPANFIAEGLDQTRGWFYTLMVISTALFDKPAFENLIVNGLVLAEDGKKMSKRLKNYPDPMLVVSEYGADALRVYLISSPVVRAEPLKFKKSGVYDVLKEIFIPWFNTYRLFVAQARRLEVEEGISFEYDPHIHTNTDNDMDRWIMASLQSLVRFVRQEMEQYRLDTVVPEALKFLDQLSKWYVRLNKGRLKGDEGSEDAHRALKVLFEVLLKLCRLMSPLTPFFTEFMYQNLKSVLPEGIKMDSVHFLSIPAVIEEAFDDDIERDVSNMQRVVDLGRIARENSGFTSFRFPYPELLVIHRSKVFLDGISRFSGYIKEQLNVKKITLLSEIADYVTLSIRADSGKLGPRFRSKKDQFIAALGELDFESLIRLLEVGKLDVDFFDGSSNSVETVVLDDDVFLEFKFRGDASRYEAVSFGELVVIVDKQMDLDCHHEGLGREIVSRIQRLRKEIGLSIEDKIDVAIDFIGECVKLREAFAVKRDFIDEKLRQKLMLFSDFDDAEKPKIADEVRDVADEQFRILIFKKE